MFLYYPATRRPAIPDLTPLLFLAGFLFWLALSIALLLRLEVFRASPLLSAPRRDSRLSLFHFAAIIILYIGIEVLAATVLLAISPGGNAKGATDPAPVSQAASTLQTTSTPATAAASTLAATDVASTASALASATAPPSAATSSAATAATSAAKKSNWPLRANAIDTVIRIVMAAFMLYLAANLVDGRLRGFGLSAAQFFPGVAKGILAFFILAPLLMVLQKIVEAISDALRHGVPPPQHPFIVELRQNDASMAVHILIVVAAIVVAPIAEELLFRGFLQTALLRLFPRRVTSSPLAFSIESPDSGSQTSDTAEQSRNLPRRPPSAQRRWIVILTSAFLFTFVHFSFSEPNWEAMPILACLSVALAYLYERTGNLWATMTLHACFNGTNILLVYLTLNQ